MYVLLRMPFKVHPLPCFINFLPECGHVIFIYLFIYFLTGKNEFFSLKVGVIPKRELAGTSPHARPSFGMTMTQAIRA